MLGYWCPDSERIVPGMVKAVHAAQNPNLAVLGVNIAYEETDELPIDVGAFPIRKFPTIIVLRGRHEHVSSPEPSDELIRFVEQPLDPDRLAAAMRIEGPH